MKEIKLINSDKMLLVDEDDYELLSKFKWRLNNGYPQITLGPQHIIMRDNPNNLEIDHINRNPLDNRKENLRLCTRQQNIQNRGTYKNRGIKYKGVKKHSKNTGKFVAYINPGKMIHLGYYDDEVFAAKVYDQAARHFYGEFAFQNFPDLQEDVIDLNKALNKKQYTLSKYHGVSLKKKKYCASLSVKGKYVHIGVFESEIDAAKAREQYIKENNLDTKKYKLNFEEVKDE
jgi:hypothetical protein